MQSCKAYSNLGYHLFKTAQFLNILHQYNI